MTVQSLFDGLDRAYGTYELTGAYDDRGKADGKAVTFPKPVTDELWERHLKGEQGLGIVPIRDDQCVLFAALDIDFYPVDHKAINRKCREMGLPFVVCVSKSRGAHLFVFFSEPARADRVIGKLKELRKALGYDGCEVFPKQRKLGEDETGNWINIPYFACLTDDGSAKSHDRYALDDDGKGIIELDKFVAYCESKRISEQDFLDLEAEADDLFADGPPCLQRIHDRTVQAGERNQSLYNIGIYYRQKYGEDAAQHLEAYNTDHVDPPVGRSEIDQLIKQVKKKQNFYTCESEPICRLCDKATCQTRRYGVGGGDSEMERLLTSLKKVESYDHCERLIHDEVSWFLTVDGVELMVTTEELLNQKALTKKILNVHGKLLDELPPRRYRALISGLVDRAAVVKRTMEGTRLHALWVAVVDFIDLKGCADDRLGVTIGRAWKDPEKGDIWFATHSLEEFLIGRNLLSRSGQKHEAYALMEKHFDMKRTALKLQDPLYPDKTWWCWSVPSFVKPTEPSLPAPSDVKRQF